MSFSTLIFLLLFLPLYLIFYMRSDSISGKNNVLLVFSLIFYAFGGLKYLLLLIIMAAAGWAFGLAIERANSKKNKQTLLVLSVVIFLAVLGIFSIFQLHLSKQRVCRSIYRNNLFIVKISAELACVVGYIFPVGISSRSFKEI